jgi:hypothetical protein
VPEGFEGIQRVIQIFGQKGSDGEVRRANAYSLTLTESDFSVRLPAYLNLGSAAAAGEDVSRTSESIHLSRDVGGAFSLLGNHIIGRHLELVADQRIVQA